MQSFVINFEYHNEFALFPEVGNSSIVNIKINA